MWKCSKCGEMHADHFSSCWRCAGMEAPPRAVNQVRTATMGCSRCNNTLAPIGATPAGFGAVLPPGANMEVYLCTHCGYVELFLRGVGEVYRAEVPAQIPRTAEGKVGAMFQEATRSETREELEAAIIQFEEVKAKYPGTNYARDADERLTAIRTKLTKLGHTPPVW